ncbi:MULTISPECIES: GNAT family N-acetyltransferase [unclassified Bosea (in: a-proteobacteria)]|uniref:GNAT family N-acetyltransferase n=1 Tax=unclassified Bosea (in: a-proteobacteria) TaxID=2653178 RepID=UPI001358AC97|nr:MULTISPECIES: GNAT family N-acetyltransferase [unclassified Bosea (in: a-proteobacteria)]
MIRLEADKFDRVLPQYLSETAFFPLIAAVLNRSQDGAVWVDEPAKPRQVYVEHSFGFAQIFGEPVSTFESGLESYLSERRDFTVEKVRLYGPQAPAFLRTPAFSAYCSERQRFTLARDAPRGVLPLEMLKSSPAVAADVDEIQARFGVVARFWRSADDFVRFSQACVIREAGAIAAVCYAAAIGGEKAEIDVVTDPHFRRRGLAHQAVAGFAASCFASRLEPVWDCFTNNIPSVRTALSLGFSPKNAPYAFFTIPRA